MVHEGTWYDIPKSYEKLIDLAGKGQFRLSGQNREIYINIDFNRPQSNVTEIQLGILSDSEDILNNGPMPEVENFSRPFMIEMV